MASNYVTEDEDLDQLCAITGVTREAGERLLEACNGNIQLAIEMHMDGGSGGECSHSHEESGVHSAAAGVAASAVENENDEVRAPIPQRSETLVEEVPTFVQEYMELSGDDLLGFRGRRRKARSVFDGFRDFQAEAKQQEEMMRSGSSSSLSKRRTLEDLFRPPIDITFKGSFASMRDTGTNEKKWLLVNIQNVQEFSCQALNRDLWSNLSVKSIIKSHFLFWQVYHDSEEGSKFRQFYKVKDWPYVAIIDPRTGENMISWNKIDATSFSELVSEFISEHPFSDSESDAEHSAAKRPRVSSIVDASEDAQIKAAIDASLAKTTAKKTVIIESESDLEESDDLETFTDSEDNSNSCHSSPMKKCPKAKISETIDNAGATCSKSATNKTISDNSKVENSNDLKDVSSEETDKNVSEDLQKSSTVVEKKSHTFYLGKEEDPQTSLMIRFPDGKRQQWSVSCESKLMALVLFVSEQGFPNERFELVTNFPRRKLSYMDFDITIKEAGLHPQESIFVQAR